MDKRADVETTIGRINDGSVLMVAGFLGVGTAELLIDTLCRRNVKDLTVIVNDCAFDGVGVGRLIRNRQVKRLITSHVGTNPEAMEQIRKGNIALEFVPQGTLIERIRAAGAGLGGVLTPTGIGTVVEEGKQRIVVNGRPYILEIPLKADVAFIKAYKADTGGNLVFRRTARNYNPVMAMAADFVAAEAEYLEAPGRIDPDDVMLPGIFVDAVILPAEEGTEALLHAGK